MWDHEKETPGAPPSTDTPLEDRTREKPMIHPSTKTNATMRNNNPGGESSHEKVIKTGWIKRELSPAVEKGY